MEISVVTDITDMTAHLLTTRGAFSVQNII